MKSRLSLRALSVVLLLLAACTSTEESNKPPQIGSWRAIALGVAQDGGVPHLGCFKTCCAEARAAGLREAVAALAIESSTGWWLVDATPDLSAQVHAMGSLPRGILLTHAHIGHYTGLMALGREVMNAHGMPVYASAKMAEFLSNNGPWDQLVKLGNIELLRFEAEVPFELEPGLRITAHEVPHRNEYADTHAFSIGALLYVPDIDRWETWTPAQSQWTQYETLVVDGTFFNGDELPGRDMREIPHPTIEHTLSLLRELPQHGRVWFTHFNHSNPVWDERSAAAKKVVDAGCGIARTGAVLYQAPQLP